MEEDFKSVWCKINYDDLSRCTLYVHCCKLGDFITEGHGEQLKFNIVYSEHLEKFIDKLVDAIESKFIGTIRMVINKRQFIADTSLWPKIARALQEFVLINQLRSLDKEIKTDEDEKREC